MATVTQKPVKFPSPRLKGMKEFMQDYVQDSVWKPSRIDASLLKKMGNSKGKEDLAIKALRFLGIIDDEGVPTEEFDHLKKDYQPTLRRLVQEKYSELLSLFPLAKIDQPRLVSYFGKPVETAEYQGMFFAWLCQQAGIELPNVPSKFHRARFDKKKKYDNMIKTAR
jgi:hypothetical protein